MTDLMKLRLRGDGPDAWRFRIEDAETGKCLPVMNFTLDVKDGVMTLDCTLMVSDVEIEGLVNIGKMLADLASEPEPESVDGWAQRTVSLIIDGDDG